MENIYDAKTEELNKVLSDIENELEKVDAPMKITTQVLICVEEIFVNVASYAYPEKEGKVKINYDITENSIEVVFSDDGIEFNPLMKDDPDITLSAEERNIGGLGIFMVKKTMDEVIYERKNNQNILKIVKKW